MKTVGNIIIGKAAITGTTFKVDGKKYKLTEKFSGILEKLDLEGRTAAFYLNKDGDIDGVQLNGVYTVRGVEVPSYKEEGTTYKASYIVALGTACNLKEGRPFRFSVATRNKDNESVFYECKTWDDVAERAAVELAVPDGEKKPRVWVVARASKHNGRDQYTVEDYGVISD
jgi:hypothetical protein